MVPPILKSKKALRFRRAFKMRIQPVELALVPTLIDRIIIVRGANNVNISPLLDMIKDLADFFQSLGDFLSVHLPGIVSMTGKLVQVISYAGQQTNQFDPLLSWCLSYVPPSINARR